MKTVSCAGLVAAVLALGHLGLTAAETARFRHVVSAYADAAGGAIHLPEGVACDANGQVVVGDTGNDRLLRFSYRERALTGGRAIRIPELSAPSRVQLDANGEIYALDGKQRRIVRLGPEGEFRGALAFDGVPPPATIVPKAFALDGAGNLYVLDVFSGRVIVLNAQGKFQRAIALAAETGFASEVGVDPAGNVLVLDSIGRRLYSAGKEAATFTPLGGDLSEALATLPTYLLASKGMIFVVEGIGSSIVAFGREGSFLARQLAMGWEEGSLNHPSQICINDKDEVFVADRDNSRVQVFQLTR